MRKLGWSFLLLVVASLNTPSLFAQAANPDAYDRLLVPVYFFGAGAHGSQWVSDIEAVNSQGSPVELAQAILSGNPLCPELCGCHLVDEIAAHSSAEVCGTFASDAGLFMYVPKDAEANQQIHWHAWIQDTSRQSESAGTEIPIVAQSQFRTNDLVLSDVPSDSRFRAALRLYGVNDGDMVDVKIFDSRDLTTPLANATIRLTNPIVNVVFNPFPSRPAYAMIADLVAAYPQLGAVSRYTIEVQRHFVQDPPSLTHFWAFVTITNNDTQEVTTVTPQAVIPQ